MLWGLTNLPTRRSSGVNRLFDKYYTMRSGEAAQQMLGSLKNEVPSQVGKNNEIKALNHSQSPFLLRFSVTLRARSGGATVMKASLRPDHEQTLTVKIISLAIGLLSIVYFKIRSAPAGNILHTYARQSHTKNNTGNDWRRCGRTLRGAASSAAEKVPMGMKGEGPDTPKICLEYGSGGLSAGGATDDEHITASSNSA